MKTEDSLVTLVGEIKEQLLNKEPDVPLTARYPYLAIMWQRYQLLKSKTEKSRFLDESMAVTKMSRSYLNRIFISAKVPARKCASRVKKSRYESIVTLVVRLWKYMNYCGGKKMRAAMPDWVPCLDATLQQRQLLYRISGSEIDRILKPFRAERRRKNATGTMPSKHRIKTEVPIKPLGAIPKTPGFLEIDTVAHCGESLSGHFFLDADCG